MIRVAIIALFISSTPALALDVDLASLLANPDALPEAALASCALGVTDPTAAGDMLTEAGWDRSEGDGDGTWEYTNGGVYLMLWDTPGFCMVEDLSLRTVELSDAIQALAAHSLPTGTDADGCETFDLGDGITATLTGPGQDPVCTSDDGATMRFETTP
jgi:hypothetical protein